MQKAINRATIEERLEKIKTTKEEKLSAIQEKKSLIIKKEGLLVELKKKKAKAEAAAITAKANNHEAQYKAFMTQAANAEKEIVATNLEIAKAKQDQKDLEFEVTGLTLQQAEGTIQLKQNAAGFTSILGNALSILTPMLSILMTMHTIQSAINDEKLIGIGLTKKENLEEAKGLTTKVSNMFAKIVSAFSSAGIPGVIAGITLATVLAAALGVGIAASMGAFNSGSEVDQTSEAVNKLSNKIYQLETKANAINTITKSYDDLDKKLIQTNADQEEMNKLLDQAADKLDEEQKNAYNALQTNEDRLKYLKAIRQQSEEEADALRKQQINSISNASASTKNALLDENTTDSKILTAQAAIYANNNNELYKYIDSLTEAKAGIEDLAEVLLSELTPAQALAFAEQPELISKLVDSLNSLSTTYTSLSDSSVKGTAAEVLTSDDYSIVDKVNAYKDAISSLDNEMAKILETTYSDIAVFAEFDKTVLDFIDKKNFTTDGINSVGKAIQELGYNTAQSTQMIQLLFGAINNGLSIREAIYSVFGRGLSDEDYNTILKSYSDAIGTGVLNMGQNIQTLKNTISSFYETAMKWNDLTDTEKTSFMVDNAELFKGQSGAQLLQAIESQDYNLIYAALSDPKGTLYKQVQQRISDIDEEIQLEYAKLEKDRDYVYIKYLEDQKKILQDSENLYAVSLENQLEQEQKYLNEYKSYLEDQKEALTDSLDKRKEAYSDYFETVNQEADTEDFKTQEQTLIANISKLATTGNATAANQAANLEQQLKDLEKERLQTLRQQAQDNLMNSIEDEVSEINEKFDKLLNSQSALLAAMTQDLSDPTKFLSNIIANKATQEGLTMTGLQSYVKDIQSIYSPLLGNDVLSKISVREEGNSLILNVNGEEINLSNSDQQSIYEAIMLALKQVGLK